MSIELLEYDEVTRLVDAIARTNPPPDGASFCTWFYVAGFRQLFAGPLYADIVDMLDELMKQPSLMHADDATAVWFLLEHALRQRLIRQLRPLMQNAGRMDEIELLTRDFSKNAVTALERVPRLLELLDELQDEQLSTAMEHLLLNADSRDAGLVRLRQNNRFGALAECCAQALRDAVKGRYANIGAFCALLDKKYNVVVDPARLLTELQERGTP